MDIGLTSVVGIGLVCFLLVQIAFNLDKEHRLLKLFLIFFTLAMLILIPKTVIDYQNPTSCWPVLNHTDEFRNSMIDAGAQVDVVVNANYTYQTICFNGTATNVTSGNTFYNANVWLFRLFLTYIVIYIFYRIYLSFTGKRIEEE